MTELRVDQTGRHTKFVFEGIDITDAIRDVTITIDPNRCAKVELDLKIDEIEITALAERDHTIMVGIPEHVAEVLQLLGWIKTDRTTYRIPRVEEDYG